MRLAWFKNLNSVIQVLILAGLLFVLILFYIPLSKYIKPQVASLLFLPIKLSAEVSANAKHFLRFQDLAEENKRLKNKIGQQNLALVQLQEASLENQRLRDLLSLPQRKTFKTSAALLIGKDSSNWTKTALINRGTLSGVNEGMPVIFGAGLVGKIIEAGPNISKLALIVDFNSKIPALIQGTREEGIVFGTLEAGRNICKMKYLQEVKIGDKIITSGLGRIYPKGLLIGEVIAVEEEKNRLYKVARVRLAVDTSTLEEVMVITGQ